MQIMSKSDKKQLHTVYGDDVFAGVVSFFCFGLSCY